MFARIEEDLINNDEVVESRNGLTIVGNSTMIEGPLLVFRALDDDRIPYYIGSCDDEALERVLTWTKHDAGVTIVQVLDIGQLKWVDTIS